MTREWDADDQIHATKGPKGDTAFLKENYKMMSIGGSFRTVKARFPPRLIRDGAKRAGFVVEIKDEDPWLKVTVIGKIPSKPPAPKKQDVYAGAGKVYPSSAIAPDIFS